jgi:hypothetical protein
MKFGDALRAIFEAHYRDAESKEPCTRYTNSELKEAFKTITANPKTKLFIYQEFRQIYGVLEREILSCKHTNVKVPWQGCEQCTDCLSMRQLEREDKDINSYNERMVWGAWYVGYVL